MGRERVLNYFVTTSISDLTESFFVDIVTTNPSLLKENSSCYLDKGQSYSGKKNVTKSGKTCVYWNEIPHIKNSNFVMLEKNYCRNPEGYGAKPWCYVNPINRTWDYCEIKPCAKVNESKELTKFEITHYELKKEAHY